MKKVLFLFISALMAVLFSGCAGKPIPQEPINIGTKFYDNGDLYISGYYPQKNYSSAKTQEDTSTIQKLAIMTKKAAEIFKENDFKYFVIESKNYPLMLTNIKDIADYCYPNNKEFGIKETKNTSLEEKCSIEKMVGKEGNQISIGVIIVFRGIKNPEVGIPSWNVDSVLRDKNIEGYINAVLKYNDIKNDLTYKYSVEKK